MNKYVENIFFTVAGAILPFIFSYIWKFIKYIYIIILNKDNNVLTGKWYTYHYSYEHQQLIFRTEEWKIKLSLNGYNAITNDKERPFLVYKGILKNGNDSSLIGKMCGVGSSESYYIKIKYPIPNKDKNTYAIVLGLDFDSNKVATIYLFSRNSVDDITAKTLIDKKLNNSKKQLRI